jgi:hypothetical protein
MFCGFDILIAQVIIRRLLESDCKFQNADRPRICKHLLSSRARYKLDALLLKLTRAATQPRRSAVHRSSVCGG